MVFSTLSVSSDDNARLTREKAKREREKEREREREREEANQGPAIEHSVELYCCIPLYLGQISPGAFFILFLEQLTLYSARFRPAFALFSLPEFVLLLLPSSRLFLCPSAPIVKRAISTHVGLLLVMSISYVSDYI